MHIANHLETESNEVLVDQYKNYLHAQSHFPAKNVVLWYLQKK